MKFKDLKDYHACYVTTVLFLVSCFIFRDMVFFPLACCFLCLGFAKQAKSKQPLTPDSNAPEQTSLDTPSNQ
ncbi:hypothetical protein AAK899_06510 [Erysipelotrichaceae bacterium 51-3]